MAALLLFFTGYVTFCFGLGSLTALALHRRWPALGGANTREAPPTSAAMRQGVLFAIGMLVLALLAILDFFDLAFVLFTVILIGLVEAFVQSKR